MSKKLPKQKVLFVCLGNICRSPTAEGVLKVKLVHHNLHENIEVASAGTSDYHAGAAPDPRSQKAALKRGYDLSKIQSQPVQKNHFIEFDYILAMDESNLQNLKEICPTEHQHKLILFLEKFLPTSKYKNVPDPYLGQADGFELVLDLLEESCENLISAVSPKLKA